MLLMLPEAEQLQAITTLMQVFSARSYSTVDIPDDFFDLCLRAMTRLKQVGRSNVVYRLVKGLGNMREDQSDSCLPTLRMPMDLLEYVINFYSCKSLSEVNVTVYLLCVMDSFSLVLL